MSNGEEIVVRAAMKPLPTLMKPLGSVDLATGEAANALVERSDVSAVEALAVVAEAAVAWELARAAREKFGGDALGDFVAAWRAYLERIDWTPLKARRARRLHGRGEVDGPPRALGGIDTDDARRGGAPASRSRRSSRRGRGGLPRARGADGRARRSAAAR